MTWIGHFDQQYNPRLHFYIVNDSNDRFEFDGIIDTGFTGFVQIPLTRAAAMGIISDPISAGVAHLANGATQRVWLKEAKVEVDGESATGTCLIPQTPHCPVLIGLDFLRRFQRALVVSNTIGVAMIPEQEFSLS